ncbi:MAG: hypothetical protein LBR83_08760 [Clostridiales bacterium]|jgi:hypothetical protein|nr:hypothetical protein [Clostridiales bacterium]
MSSKELYWNLFTESGDPTAYMEYRRQDSPQKKNKGNGNRPGGTPGGGAA